jgi:hypothetical protein
MAHRGSFTLHTSSNNDTNRKHPVKNGSNASHWEQYEYGVIEAPQTFPSNFTVDWRAVRLDLWSQCYCRYDQNYLPTMKEQEILMDLNNLKDRLRQIRDRSQRHLTLDTYDVVRRMTSKHRAKHLHSSLAMPIRGIQNH